MSKQAVLAQTTCPECGAPAVNGISCWDRLGIIIAWEYQDPALLAEHFLTVASYNLQHPAQFVDEAIDGLRSAFIEKLDNTLAVEYIRQRAATAYAGSTRVLRKASERHPVARQWQMTIADVALPDQTEGAAERVRTWARAIRSEL